MATSSLFPGRAFPGWRLRVAGRVCAVVGAAVLVAFLAGLLVVVSGHLVLGWVVAAAFAVLSIVLQLVGRSYGMRVRTYLDTKQTASIVFAVLAGLVACGCLLVVVDEQSRASRWSVVGPAGPTGCQVAARETAFIGDGEGAVYVGRGVLLRRAGHYSAAGGYRPFTRGAYTLTWQGDEGRLELIGRTPGAIKPSTLTLAC